jgi:hypothetical protein
VILVAQPKGGRLPRLVSQFREFGGTSESDDIAGRAGPRSERRCALNAAALGKRLDALNNVTQDVTELQSDAAAKLSGRA